MDTLRQLFEKVTKRRRRNTEGRATFLLSSLFINGYLFFFFFFFYLPFAFSSSSILGL